MWLSNTLQTTLIVYFYPHRCVNEGNTSGVAEVQAQAQREIDGLLDQLDAKSAGPAVLMRSCYKNNSYLRNEYGG